MRNPVKTGRLGTEVLQEVEVPSDVLPALISVHVGSETKRLGEMPIQ